jgi:hypothetical protein
MTAINFPSSPTNGQTFTVGNKTYVYDSTKQVWKVSATVISGGGGGLSASQVYGLTTVFNNGA